MHQAQQGPCEQTFWAFNADRAGRCRVALAEERLIVGSVGSSIETFRLDRDPPTLICAAETLAPPVAETERLLLAAIEAVLSREPHLDRLRIGVDRASGLCDALIASGVTIEDGAHLVVAPELFWQLPSAWLAHCTHAPFPQIHVTTDGKRHPLRPPRPKGTLYARFIPWLDQVISFRVLDIETDVACFNRWMNDPRIATIWDEAGDLYRHRDYLEARLGDPHALPLIGCFDGAPFGYFEVYWAKENRLGPYYDADDYDRGWHVAVGEDAFRGKAWITAWLPSLMHFMFLDEPRTQRIVGEPSAAHAQQIRNLDKSGFAKIKHFDFPHKRALLVMLLRERFFGDRLWAPDKTGSERAASLSSASSIALFHRGEQAVVR
ncbi:GNAT family N-acetyltransferase [Methylocapsa aurea]|uniref:GNAT family N-acetyltransferase n=1 Tax=Methylocapsa aurea TaxID=663610 RepID=UPI000A0200D3|nr:GNAT family N-acetyltransferase [Methylocapsa aurea]